MSAALKRLRESLTARLLLVFVFVCLCMLALIAVTIAHGFGSSWDSGIKPHLRQYVEYIIQDIGSPPNLERAQKLSDTLPLTVYIEGPGSVNTATGNLLQTGEFKFEADQYQWRNHGIDSTGFFQLGSHFSFGEINNHPALRSQRGDYTVYYEVVSGESARKKARFIWFALTCLVAILGIAYFLLQRMLKPVQDITRGVDQMGQGHLSYRVPVRAPNDLGQLATAINTMAGDIENMLDAKRQLLLALSHELRSPLTRAKIATQLLEDSRNKFAIEDDIREMESLISEILEAERMNSSHTSLHRSPTDIAQLVDDVRHELHAEGVTVHMPTVIPLLPVDDTRLRLLLRNLIKNALTHGGQAEPPPSIELLFDNTSLSITVRDHGAGIDAEHLTRITEPFYRADPSRTRATGGFGLGLYLCKKIAEAHGGELRIVSKKGEGCSVTAILNCNDQPQPAKTPSKP